MGLKVWRVEELLTIVMCAAWTEGLGTGIVKNTPYSFMRGDERVYLNFQYFG